jgi:hypothetical protein
MRHREQLPPEGDALAASANSNDYMSDMPVLPRSRRLSLHDAIKYVAEGCKCETEKAGKAFLAALSEGALVASANVLVSDRSYMPGIIAGPLPVGPPRRVVDAGIGPVPSELWAGYPWPDFLRRAVLPRGNPMYRARAADGQSVGPIYSHPTIATPDIDAWLDRDDGSHKPPAGTPRGLIGTIYEAIQLKPGAFGFAIDLNLIFDRVWRYFSFR